MTVVITLARAIGVRRLITCAAVALLVLTVGGVIAFLTILGGLTSSDEAAAQAAGCGDSGSPVQATASGAAAVVPAAKPGSRWSAEQTQNAEIIAREGTRTGAGPWGITVALAAAMQESGLRNLTYGDADSVGLFQQRPSTGYPQAYSTDPATAADMFFGGPVGHQYTAKRGLLDIPGWQQMALTQSAQSVQASAFPDAYAHWEVDARALTETVLADQGVSVVNCTIAEIGAVTGDWANPLAPAIYTVTSPFGYRLHPILHIWRLHAGTDLAAPTGTLIRSACTGSVVSTGWDAGGGNVTTIDCGGGVTTLYEHQSAFQTTPGTAVGAGDIIGLVGSTGGSTGPHLHFQVEVAGRPTDPVPFMEQRGVTL